MPSSELTEWAAYYRLEPFGAERDNWHAALLCALFANAHRKKGAKAVAADAFMYRDRESQRQKNTTGFMAGLRSLGKRKK